MTALNKKAIKLIFRLGTGSFGESGFNTIEVTGKRVRASITKAGGASMGQAQIRVYGLTPSVMNELTALTTQTMMLRENSVTVLAGDDGATGMPVIFAGTISEGWADLNDAPDASLYVSAFAGLVEAVKPANPTSYPGKADAVAILANMAGRMGLFFENSGVTPVMVSTPYFAGSLREQAMSCARAISDSVEVLIDDGTLAIWPKGGSRGAQVALVSPDTGMVGYPAYNGTGISVTTRFNPAIGFGQAVRVESSIKTATGEWFVHGLQHEIDSESPGGEWFTHFQGAPLYNTNVITK